jgi:small subunit ribosomal protein S21
MAQSTRRTGQRFPDRSARGFFGVYDIARTPARVATGEFQIVQIVVRDNNVDQALKALKKKMQREGLFREMKRRNHFEKPSERKAREKAEAVRRARKLARKRAQREGLLPKT